jgi:hypothetical protein
VNIKWFVMSEQRQGKVWDPVGQAEFISMMQCDAHEQI